MITQLDKIQPKLTHSYAGWVMGLV